MSPVAVSIAELLLIYLLPIGVFVAAWIVFSTLVWALLHSPLDFDFKHDFARKFEDKRGLPSGRQRVSLAYVAKSLLGDSCIQAVLLYRIARFLAARRMRSLAEVVNALSRLVTHTDLSPWSTIEPGLYLYHGLGTVVGKGARVGRRALICHGVSVGGGAILGDDVKIWAGAQVLAGVTIGDRSEVSANAVVTSDFPADSVLFGIPARLAGRKAEQPQTAENV